MNLKFLFVILLVFAGLFTVQAQRRTVEERTRRVVDTLATVFRLDKAVQDQAGVLFTEYYTAMDKLREGSAQGGRPDRAEVEKLLNARDEKLKKVLTEEQFKKYKDELEPALRPRRRQG